MKKEPWKTEKARLREVFDDTVIRVWEQWDSYEIEGTPFKNLPNAKNADIETSALLELYWDVGWARGVSEAFGWSLDRPGPREWSPRDR